jgi:hypothetical protein
MNNPELLAARELAGTLTDAEADELADAFDADAWLEDRRMDALLRTRVRSDEEFAARLRATLVERGEGLRRLKSEFLAATDFSARIGGGLLQGLTREQLVWSPRPDMPPILWHVAHLALTDAVTWVGAWKGDWDSLDPVALRRFAMGSAMPQDFGTWPSLAELETQRAAYRGRVVEIVEALAPGDLARPLPHLRPGFLEPSMQTPEGCLRMLAIHHVWHSAEINVLCRLQGRERLL